MARRFFAVAFRALHLEKKESMLNIEVVSGQSTDDVERKALEDIKLQLTQEDGWSDWAVNVHAIPQDVIERVVWEARCFDQTGVSCLYGVVIVAINREREQTAFCAGYSLAVNETHAKIKLEKYVSDKYPATDGWEVTKTAIEEWDVREVIPGGRRERYDMSSCCGHR